MDGGIIILPLCVFHFIKEHENLVYRIIQVIKYLILFQIVADPRQPKLLDPAKQSVLIFGAYSKALKHYKVKIKVLNTYNQTRLNIFLVIFILIFIRRSLLFDSKIKRYWNFLIAHVILGKAFNFQTLSRKILRLEFILS